MQSKPTPPYRILRRDEVIAKTGLSRSNIYKQIANGTFPRQLNLGSRIVGWLESDIDEWINGLITKQKPHEY